MRVVRRAGTKMSQHDLGWSERSGTRAFVGMVAIFLFVVCGLLVVVLASTSALSGVRAYVAGEGLWSKGQKEATLALQRYARSRDERDWRTYQQGIEVTLADRRAREALLSARPDLRAARAGFLGGRNHPDDAGKLIWL